LNNAIARQARRVALGVATTAVASMALAGGAMADSGAGNGPFVIGDQGSLAQGTEVTFWGAQWWKQNPLSTGLAPASFKGYADNAGTCGGTWTTRPGNSSAPPAALSGTVPVIVSTSISKSGPVISGDIKAIVLVAPDGGYDGNPGHPGTGKIVGYVCGAGPAEDITGQDGDGTQLNV
jgi:hypothetical protein